MSVQFLEHARHVTRVCEHRRSNVAFLAKYILIVIIDVPKLIEWVQVGFCSLHTDKHFIVNVFLALHVLHLKETIENAT